MIMSKAEVHNAAQVWPANVKAPLSRDEVIALIKSAEQRRQHSIRQITAFIRESSNVDL